MATPQVISLVAMERHRRAGKVDSPSAVAPLLFSGAALALTGKRQAFVAYYCGEAKQNATEAARLAGYAQPHSQGPRLLENVDVSGAIAAFRAEIRARGIANLQNRIDSYCDDFARTDDLIAARATDPDTQRGPGGDTGLIVHRTKGMGSGDNFMTVDEFEFDAALLTARLNLRRQIAQELGEWTERSEFAGKDGGAIEVRFTVVDSRHQEPS